MKTTLSIPFPAWDGMFQLAAVCDKLRQEELLKGIPDFRTPRRITIRSSSHLIEGVNDVKVVDYWIPGGSYATVVLEGSDDPHYGTQWSLIDLRVQWIDPFLPVCTGDKKIVLRLHKEDLADLNRQGRIKESLLDPIHAAVARQEEWLREVREGGDGK